jgi:Zn-dependent peptidase ImmA (M78 family)/DNA-binding XRE family transcriptional regulator
MMNNNVAIRSNLRKIVPQRLREARLARGLTIKEVADFAGVRPQAVSRYELGELIPGAETFMKIQRILQMPIKFYEKPCVNEIIRSVEFFRSYHTATKAVRDSATIKSQWISREIFPYLGKYITFPPVDPLFTKVKEMFHTENVADRGIEALSKYVRKEWGLGVAPIPNLIRLLEKRGVIVCVLSIDEKLDGFSFWENGRPFIFVSNTNNAVRLRQSVSHELGHLLMHSASDVVENLKKWEQQAKFFASVFLLPSGGFDQDVISTALNQLLFLKQRWMVSVQAMIMRCEALGIISEEKATYLWKEISRKKWRKNEPLDNEIEPERPVMLQQAMQLIVKHGLRSKTQIEDELGYPIDMIIEFCCLKKDFFSDGELVGINSARNNKFNSNVDSK